MLFMSMFSLVMMVHVFHDHGVYFLMLVVHDFVCLYWFMALSCAGCVSCFYCSWWFMITRFSVIFFMFMAVHGFYFHGDSCSRVLVLSLSCSWWFMCFTIMVFVFSWSCVCVCHVFVSVHAFHVVHVHVFHVHVDSCFPWSLWFMFSMVMVVHVSFTCWSFMIFRGILVHDGLIMRHGGSCFQTSGARIF